MSEDTRPTGYSGGGTSNTGEITGAGGGAGTAGLGGAADGNHPVAPAPTEDERRPEEEDRARDDDRRSG